MFCFLSTTKRWIWLQKISLQIISPFQFHPWKDILSDAFVELFIEDSEQEIQEDKEMDYNGKNSESRQYDNSSENAGCRSLAECTSSDFEEESTKENLPGWHVIERNVSKSLT